MEAKGEILELNRKLQEEKRKGDVNLRDQLTKQREITEMDKKWEDMQTKMDAMEKQVMIGGAYVNLEMLGVLHSPKKLTKPCRLKASGSPPWKHMTKVLTSLTILRCSALACPSKKPATPSYAKLFSPP